MRVLSVLLAFAVAILVAGDGWAQPRQKHIAGRTALSADGRYVAFHTGDMDATEFFLTDIETGRSFHITAPDGHTGLGDFVWTRTGATLLFVSVVPPERPLLAPHVLEGIATHVWAMDVSPQGPGKARLLATGDGVRLPALSPDGSRVAYFMAVRLPREAPPAMFYSRSTYAVFETDIASGETTRVAPSQFKQPRALFYDGADRWLFAADEPAYLVMERGMECWCPRPAPPGKGTHGQLTDGINTYRLERGEQLPAYPDFKTPYPPMGVAPPASTLIGQTIDGRPILFGAPGPENTKANQHRNMLSNYSKGVSRVEMTYGYMAIGADAIEQVYYPPPFPQLPNTSVSSPAVDAGLRRYAQVLGVHDPNRMPSYRDPESYQRLLVHEGNKLVLERRMTELAAEAIAVTIGATGVPKAAPALEGTSPR